MEAHRWSYVSADFSASENVLNYDIRRAKQSSVHASLRNSSRYVSNQGEIWDKIEEMSILWYTWLPLKPMNRDKPAISQETCRIIKAGEET